MFFHKEHEKVKKNIDEFLATIIETYDLLVSAIDQHLTGVGQGDFRPFMDLVMNEESKADDLRREIEQKLYKKSLLPELRKDILLTLNQLDKLPDQAELIVKCIYQLDLTTPSFLIDQERKLSQLGSSTVSLVTQLTREVFNQNGNVDELITLIDSQESQGDQLESDMITALFKAESVSDFDKILLREKILKIGKVLDLCQTISDHLTIISIKRQV